EDVFIRKFTPDGTALVYTFFFGGEDFEQAGGIAVDGAGAAYVTGSSSSKDFPSTPGAFQPNLAWTPEDPTDPDERPMTDDAFVAKVNPAGNALVYATYLGGQQLENSSPWGAIA